MFEKRAEKRTKAPATEKYCAMVVYMEVYWPPVLIRVVRRRAVYCFCPSLLSHHSRQRSLSRQYFGNFHHLHHHPHLLHHLLHHHPLLPPLHRLLCRR